MALRYALLVLSALCVWSVPAAQAQPGAPGLASETAQAASVSAARTSKAARKTRKARKRKAAKRQAKSHYGVLGKDDRIRPGPEHLSLLSSVGILFNNQVRSVCTAFCISPDTIVSASHCLFNSELARRLKTKRFDLSKTWFGLPARYASSKLMGSDSREIGDGIVAGLKNISKSIGKFNRDWMIVKLRKPICRASLKLAVLPMKEIRKAAREKQLLLAGFHGDELHKNMLISPQCALANWQDPKLLTRRWRSSGRSSRSIMLHNCDAYKGSSGAPILMKTQDGYQVVAMNVGNIVKFQDLRRGRKLISRKLTGKINVAVLAGAFERDARWMKTTRLVVKAEHIKHIQSGLIEAGFSPGPVDGVPGRRTSAAIKAYERKHKQLETGQPSLALYRMLVPQTSAKTDYVNCRRPGDTKPVIMRRVMCLEDRGVIQNSSQQAKPAENVNCALAGKSGPVKMPASQCGQSKRVAVKIAEIPARAKKNDAVPAAPKRQSPMRSANSKSRPVQTDPASLAGWRWRFQERYIGCLRDGSSKPEVMARRACLNGGGKVKLPWQESESDRAADPEQRIQCLLPPDDYGRRVSLIYSRAACRAYGGQAAPLKPGAGRVGHIR